MSSRRRPLVKICGVTRVEDAVAAVELGADFIGLNFWPSSPRCVDLRRAREIGAAVGERVSRVGVFVDASREGIAAAASATGLDVVQLHGDESPAILEALRLPAWRAFRGIPSLEGFRLWGGAAGFLVDARREGQPGGTGESWDYATLAKLPRDERLILVAGGITPENARAALLASGADGVDVASGVEREPGIKDREKMRRLIEEVRGVAT